MEDQDRNKLSLDCISSWQNFTQAFSWCDTFTHASRGVCGKLDINQRSHFPGPGFLHLSVPQSMGNAGTTSRGSTCEQYGDAESAHRLHSGRPSSPLRPALCCGKFLRSRSGRSGVQSGSTASRLLARTSRIHAECARNHNPCPITAFSTWRSYQFLLPLRQFECAGTSTMACTSSVAGTARQGPYLWLC